ncbi:MAG TPA: hypothetical protein VN317_05670 [Candidatus Methanoperedens sp.]|nr:hypothetical protein [Candidatus Methanoperedens sp.]
MRSDVRDVGIYYWRRQALDALDTAIRGAGSAGVEALPILGSPEHLDTAHPRRFQWTGRHAVGKRCHTNKVPPLKHVCCPPPGKVMTLLR